jgi:hypothetical protein
MKKSFLLTLLLVSIISVLAACTRYTDNDFPRGTWHSADPDLTVDFSFLYIGDDSGYQHHFYFGTYFKDGESIDVLIYADNHGFFEVHDYDEYDFVTDTWLLPVRPRGPSGNRPIPGYFDGRWRPPNILSDKLRCSLEEDSRDETGYRRLVFEKTDSRDDYDVIGNTGGHAARAPHGKWQSEDPYISLDIDPQGDYVGSFGAEIPLDVVIGFTYTHIDSEGTDLMYIKSEDGAETFFHGIIRTEGDRLFYDLTDGESNPTGQTIVFGKTGEYEIPPPEPEGYGHPGEVWLSDDPAIGISVNADSEDSGRQHPASYVKDGESVCAVAVFGYKDGGGTEYDVLRIYDGKDYVFYEGEWGIIGYAVPVFLGYCETEGDEMRFVQIPPWRRMNG